MGMYKETVLYFAKISDVIEMEEYFSNDKYSDRRDRIFEYDKSQKYNKMYNVNHIPHLSRNKQNIYFHPEKVDGVFNEQLIKDLIGKYVLISNQFIHFGSKSIEIDKKLKYFTNNRTTKFPRHIAGEKQLEKHANESEELIDIINRWIKEEFNCDIFTPCIISETPHDPIKGPDVKVIRKQRYQYYKTHKGN